MLPHIRLSHSFATLSEIAHNLRLIYWDYIRHSDFPCRSRCSQVFVLSLSLPETIKTRQPGRPKFDINEETLIERRTLLLNWNEIARMLLVSRYHYWSDNYAPFPLKLKIIKTDVRISFLN